MQAVFILARAVLAAY